MSSSLPESNAVGGGNADSMWARTLQQSQPVNNWSGGWRAGPESALGGWGGGERGDDGARDSARQQRDAQRGEGGDARHHGEQRAEPGGLHGGTEHVDGERADAERHGQ